MIISENSIWNHVDRLNMTEIKIYVKMYQIRIPSNEVFDNRVIISKFNYKIARIYKEIPNEIRFTSIKFQKECKDDFPNNEYSYTI